MFPRQHNSVPIIDTNIEYEFCLMIFHLILDLLDYFVLFVTHSILLLVSHSVFSYSFVTLANSILFLKCFYVLSNLYLRAI